MTASILQVSTPFENSGSGTTIVNNAITVAAGSYLHAIFTFSNSGSLSSVTSSPALTWTILDDINDAGNGQRVAQAVSSVTSSGSITVTGNLSSTDSFRGGIVKEIGGSSGYDSAAAAHKAQLQATPTTTTDATTSTATPALTSQPALVSGVSMNTAGVATPAAGTGFTSDATGFGFGGTAAMRSENKRVTATTGVAATFTAGNNSAHISLVAVFLETAGGASRPVKMAGQWGGFASPSGGFAG